MILKELGLVAVNVGLKSSGGTASVKYICSWWIKAVLIVKNMFLSALSAGSHEAKDSCKSSFPPCR